MRLNNFRFNSDFRQLDLFGDFTHLSYLALKTDFEKSFIKAYKLFCEKGKSWNAP